MVEKIKFPELQYLLLSVTPAVKATTMGALESVKIMIINNFRIFCIKVIEKLIIDLIQRQNGI